MSDSEQPASASFSCQHCHKDIYIPNDLPPTTAPCPHCGKEVTSPDLSKAHADSGDAKVEGAAAGQEGEAEAPAEGGSSGHELQNLAQSRVLEAREGQPGEAGSRPMLVAAILTLLAAGGIAFWLAYQWKSESGPELPAGGAAGKPVKSAQELWKTTGWKEEASRVLKGFMSAKSPQERMYYVIPNEGVRKELEMFYPEGSDDSDTPIELFAHRSGSDRDTERGIFLMQYRQPSQIDMRDYFSPIGSLDKILKVETSTLIDMANQIKEDNLSKPIGINAYFKKTEEGLKLDASVFIQGKFRTFRAFVDYPRPGKKQVFRVVVAESIKHELRNDKRYRTYRLDDFAYPEDHVNVPVAVDSEVGRILSVLNWRGTNRDLVYRTATIELGWTDEKPAKLQIERVLCWQFLGVGGEIGNIAPMQTPPPGPGSPAAAVAPQQAGE